MTDPRATAADHPIGNARKIAVAAMMAAIALAPSRARAQAAPTPLPFGAEPVLVVGVSPLAGSGVDRDKVPAATSVLTQDALMRTGTPDLIDSLASEVPGVTLDSAAGNPFQPTFFIHGFESSPLQGTSQNIAVYLNGNRFNEPFGDTVNWDLIPEIAVRSVDVESADPVFGLNALGGSINIHLKDGFSTSGGEADVSGGSFGQALGEAEYGRRFGAFAVYVAGSVEHQDGWRDLQSSDIQNFYGDLGWQGESSEVHLNLNLANSVLNGPGTAPVELLAADPAAQFTAPNLVADKSVALAASGRHDLSDTLSIEAQAYYDNFLQRVVNGNAPNDAPCNDGLGLLCSDPGTPSTTLGGAPITDFLDGGPYSELDDQTTSTNGFGASLQVTERAKLLGHGNTLIVGASFDGARTVFSAVSLLGGLTSDTRVFTGPGVVIDEPGNNVPVRVGVDDEYEGIFASDTIDVTRAVSITAAGRLNAAEIDLDDRNGGDLTGHHAYNRVDPSVGLTWRPLAAAGLYASYSEANRAPTPAELSCAGPTDSCSLANFFVGDPDLKQVVARTVEMGLRGTVAPGAAGKLRYDIDLFRTNSQDDIEFVNSQILGRAFFTNVGQTRRQGVTVHAFWSAGWYSLFLNYAYTEATFRSSFVESAGSNPAADANGNITITAGDRLPGVPAGKLVLGGDAHLTTRLSVGATATWQSGQYLFGDEANLTPRFDGFFVLDLHGSYRLTKRLEVFASIDNVTDARYSVYGTFSPTSSVFLSQAPGAANPRSENLAAPIGGFGGIRATF